MTVSSLLQSGLFSAESTKDSTLQRILQGSNDGITGGFSDNSNSSSDDGYDPASFLLWYIFLVFCFLIAPCCAYRRHQVIEHRRAQEQANLTRLQHSNSLFLLSNLQNAPQLRRNNSERVKQERSRLLTDELKGTTMTVKEENLETLLVNESPLPVVSKTTTVEVGDAASAETDVKEDDNSIYEDGEASAMERGQTNDTVNTTSALEYGIDNSDFTDDNGLVRLPEEAVNANRTVPGVCSICLCPYIDGDQISWSPEANCQHAFHTDCIIPWLAKKEEPKCPVCRQDFCPAAILQDENTVLDPEVSFLERFLEAFAMLEMHQTIGNDGGLELSHLAIQNNHQYGPAEAAADAAVGRGYGTAAVERGYGTAAMEAQYGPAALQVEVEAGVHIPASSVAVSEISSDIQRASPSPTPEIDGQQHSSSEVIHQGTDDDANADTSDGNSNSNSTTA